MQNSIRINFENNFGSNDNVAKWVRNWIDELIQTGCAWLYEEYLNPEDPQAKKICPS